MDRKDWRERLSKAKTQEGFSALFDEIPEATGHEIRTEAPEFFTMEQKTISPHLTSTTRTARQRLAKRGAYLVESPDQSTNKWNAIVLIGNLDSSVDRIRTLTLCNFNHDLSTQNRPPSCHIE